jgi:hypothetical protein
MVRDEHKVLMNFESKNLRFLVLDAEGVSHRFVNRSEALTLAAQLEKGTLSASGEKGDCIHLDFNGYHAALCYMTPDKNILWPFFLNRPASNQRIDDLSCDSCGVLLATQEELLTRSAMSRSEGFRLWQDILHRCELPDAVSEEFPDQPKLPGMKEMADVENVCRQIIWRTLKTPAS